MKLRVDLELCTGHGRCYELAEELFDDDERGHCVLRRTEVPAGLEAKARITEGNCPEGAIELEED